MGEQRFAVLQGALEEGGLHEILFKSFRCSFVAQAALRGEDGAHLMLQIAAERRVGVAALAVALAARCGRDEFAKGAACHLLLRLGHGFLHLRAFGVVGAGLRIRPEAAVPCDVAEGDGEFIMREPPFPRSGSDLPGIDALETKCISREAFKQSMRVEKAAHGVHALPPSADDPALAAIHAAEFRLGAPFFVGLGCIEHPHTCSKN